jgi:cysteine-rich repeat protein
MSHRREFLFIGMIICATQQASADTIIPGGNLVGTATTWTKAGSPYIVQGDVTVPAGTTLTLEPGTEVRATSDSDSQGSGENTTRVELIVNGTLHAEGTVAEPVIFRSTSTVAGSWWGIIATAAATDVRFTHASIRHARYGVTSLAADTALQTHDLSVSSAYSHGLWLRAGTPALDALTVTGASGYGVSIEGSASPVLTNCVVRNSGNAGVRISHAAPGRSVTLTNCTLDHNNYYNVYSSAGTGNGATITISNSIITNASYGVYRNDSASWSVTYSDVWNNSSNNYAGVTPGLGTISANPQYVSADNFHLQPTSVAIDSGTTGPTHDAEGITRPLDGNGFGGVGWDMGAYEFVATVECGNGAMEPGEQCDDGDADDADDCTATCMLARCGDGIVHAGFEGCDDGNDVDGDACSNTCVAATCGDGMTQAGEQCDDGNAVQTDACRNNCVAAACGDAIVHDGAEACDDGNTAAGDGCGPTCKAEANTPDDNDDDDQDNNDDDDDDGGGGGCQASGSSAGGLVLSWLLLGLIYRRRGR